MGGSSDDLSCGVGRVKWQPSSSHVVVPGLELDAVILEVHLHLQGVADLRRTWRVLCACGVLVNVGMGSSFWVSVSLVSSERGCEARPGKNGVSERTVRPRESCSVKDRYLANGTNRSMVCISWSLSQRFGRRST